MDASLIKHLVPQLFAITAQLEAAAPGRKFTPDGHTVGSIGEVLAASDHGLTLATTSTEGVDATAPDGRSVEIKATGGTRGVALRGQKPLADHLLVLAISAEGQESVIYNGPAKRVWGQVEGRPMQSNGQRQISLAQLRQLQQTVPAEQMLPEVG
jgi:hypothetical protein